MYNENLPRVSVIIPTYNQAQYLPICLDSAWFQDYPNIEIVVINDGSSDNTREVLDAYEGAVASEQVSYACSYNEQSGRVERCEHLRYPPQGRELRIMHHAGNKGLSEALNTGFKVSTGKYCTFIASDDMFLPSAVTELTTALEKNNADFAYADMHVVDDAGRILRRFALPSYSFEANLCHWYLLGICKLYKRELHDLSGYYDPAIAPQDHDMYLRFAMNGGHFVHVPKVLANVRIHDKDRLVVNHTPDQWSRLFEESKELVRKARLYNVNLKPESHSSDSDA